MVARIRIFDLAHLKVPVLELNPSQAVFDLHLYGSVLDVLKVTVLDSIPLDSFLAVRHLFLQLLDFKA